jgi:hypothetical protein
VAAWLGVTSGEADAEGSDDGVSEGLATGVGDAFACGPFPPPQAQARIAIASRDVESLIARINKLTQLCAGSYVSGTIQHLKQGPTLTLRASLEGVRY